MPARSKPGPPAKERKDGPPMVCVELRVGHPPTQTSSRRRMCSSAMPNTCQFKKADGGFCKRRVGGNEILCWQHSSGLIRKWHSLTRNQSILFLLGVLALAVAFPSAYWSYKGSRKSKPNNASVTNVQSTGDHSPNVIGNQGPVTIQSGDSAAKKNQTNQPPKSEGRSK